MDRWLHGYLMSPPPITKSTVFHSTVLCIHCIYILHVCIMYIRIRVESMHTSTTSTKYAYVSLSLDILFMHTYTYTHTCSTKLSTRLDVY